MNNRTRITFSFSETIVRTHFTEGMFMRELAKDSCLFSKLSEVPITGLIRFETGALFSFPIYCSN